MSPALGYQLGNVAVTFAGEDAVRSAIEGELSVLPPSSGSSPTISYRFSPPPSVENGVEIDQYLFAGDYAVVLDKYLPHGLSSAEGEDTQVDLHSQLGRWGNPAMGALVRGPDAAFNTAEARIAKRFIYEVFDQTTQLHQLRHGQSWLHSSAITDGNRTALFMAWGGVGKTSSLLKFLETGEWQFLADDLAIVDESGVVHRSPQRMQVYSYNLVGQSQMRAALLRDRGILDLAHWTVRETVLGRKRVRRRVHAEELFGPESTALTGRITDGFYLRRTTANKFSFTGAEPATVAELCASVLIHELKPLDTLLAAAGASGNSNLASMSQLTGAATDVITKALSGAGQLMIVDVPRWAGPNDLFEALSRRLA